MNIDKIDEMLEKARRLLPDDGQQLYKDFNQNLKSIIIAGLKDMDLVTREEFDVQAKLLARTRAKLDALQAQITDLEQASNK